MDGGVRERDWCGGEVQLANTKHTKSVLPYMLQEGKWGTVRDKARRAGEIRQYTGEWQRCCEGVGGVEGRGPGLVVPWAVLAPELPQTYPAFISVCHTSQRRAALWLCCDARAKINGRIATCVQARREFVTQNRKGSGMSHREDRLTRIFVTAALERPEFKDLI